nr:helix-turn-helix domain-containing protein [uncultured Actinoplanes sp.]
MGKTPLTTGTPLSPAVELIFTRWTPHIVWLLHTHGPSRFVDLQRRLAPLGTAMLARRLREMEAAGFIEQHPYRLHPPRVEYALTDLGRSVMPLLEAVERWSTDHMAPTCPGNDRAAGAGGPSSVDTEDLR